ncbi:MAG: DUF502 domain-containing protein [Candidatus Methylomirabilales bacterium]
MRQWKTTIKVKFLTGFFVLFPLLITLYVMAGFFGFVDSFLSPVYDRILLVHVPGLGFFTALLIVLLVGIVATNVVGRRILLWWEGLFLRIPIFKHIYSAIKQLLNAFSPENQVAFKEFVIVEHPKKGEYAFGFLTGEVFLVPTPNSRLSEEALLAVYIPTNHLYLGDIVLFRREEVIRPGLSIREGIQIILSGGTAIPRIITARDATADVPR